ncbi:hypothetical protein JL720_11763 [Aureococcus anophagefferens]|nr:hypothetical protein JL720_11763 [Aureococcus anophagefferens]
MVHNPDYVLHLEKGLLDVKSYKTKKPNELRVVVIRGKHLPIMDRNLRRRRPGQEKRAKFPTSKAPISVVFHSRRLRGPYVEGECDGTERRTKVVKRSLFPVWMDMLCFPMDELRGHSLHLNVMDQDNVSAADFMGRLELPLGSLEDRNAQRAWHVLRLDERPEEEPEFLDEADAHPPVKPTGPGQELPKVEVAMRYVHNPLLVHELPKNSVEDPNPRKAANELRVVFVQARNLPIMDRNALIHRSGGSTDPCPEVLDDDLHVECFDHDETSGPDFVGACVISIRELADRKLVVPLPTDLTRDNFTNLEANELRVCVIRCRNLKVLDRKIIGKKVVDPYVEIVLVGTTYKTSVKKRDVNPLFMETRVYDVNAVEVCDAPLQITVWDDDELRSEREAAGDDDSPERSARARPLGERRRAGPPAYRRWTRRGRRGQGIVGPYVTLKLGSLSLRTSVKKAEVNPLWLEPFATRLKPAALDDEPDLNLEVVVADYDDDLSSELMGRCAGATRDDPGEDPHLRAVDAGWRAWHDLGDEFHERGQVDVWLRLSYDPSIVPEEVLEDEVEAPEALSEPANELKVALRLTTGKCPAYWREAFNFVAKDDRDGVDVILTEVDDHGQFYLGQCHTGQDKGDSTCHIKMADLTHRRPVRKFYPIERGHKGGADADVQSAAEIEFARRRTPPVPPRRRDASGGADFDMARAVSVDPGDDVDMDADLTRRRVAGPPLACAFPDRRLGDAVPDAEVDVDAELAKLKDLDMDVGVELDADEPADDVACGKAVHP